MDESPFESESESLRPCCLSVGPIHPKLWEHWAWAGLGLGLLLLCFLLWAPPASMVHAQVAPSLPLLLLLCLSFLLIYVSTDLIESHPTCILLAVCGHLSVGTSTHSHMSIEVYCVYRMPARLGSWGC